MNRTKDENHNRIFSFVPNFKSSVVIVNQIEQKSAIKNSPHVVSCVFYRRPAAPRRAGGVVRRRRLLSSAPWSTWQIDVRRFEVFLESRGGAVIYSRSRRQTALFEWWHVIKCRRSSVLLSVFLARLCCCRLLLLF